MIEYIARSGPPEALNCPAFICDACRHQVVGRGNILWTYRFPSDHHESSPLFVSHKSSCVRAVEQLIGQLYPRDQNWSNALSHDLESFVATLGHNSTHAFDDDETGTYHYQRLVHPGGIRLPTLSNTPDTRRSPS